MWTPSSPYSTSWSTTSASPARKQSSTPDPRLRSVPARSSPSPSSPGAPASPAKGISILTRAVACAMPFPLCPTALKVQPAGTPQPEPHRGGSLAPGGRDEGPQMFLPSPGQLGDAPFRDANRRGQGWLAGSAYTSDGPTAWDGRRASACSGPSTPQASSRASASLRRFHRRPASGRDVLRAALSAEPLAFERGIGLHLGTLRGLLKGFEGEENYRRWLKIAMGRESSTRPSATAANPGLRDPGGGWPASVR